MLDQNLKNQLKAYLERLTRPIEIVSSLDEGDSSREMSELLQDIAGLSPLVSLHTSTDTDALRPSFVVREPGTVGRIRFAGLPMGHEFTSLVLALLQVGGYPPKTDAQLLDQVRSLKGEMVFETFISLSCQLCPDVVQALNLMSVVNSNVRHTMIDGSLFQAEVERRQIMAVPTVFLNGQPFGQGGMKLGTDWFNFNYNGLDPALSGASQNADGSIAISGTGGNDTYNAQLASASAGSSPTNWTGEAFGGGGYFQVTMSFPGTPSTSGGWPSFWANTLEGMSGQTTENVELDGVEFDNDGQAMYGSGLHDWYVVGLKFQ